MNSPILLIIQREFLTRVRKKTFLLMTLLAPVLLAAVMIVPGLLASMPEEDKTILVLDEPSILLPEEGTSQFALDYLNPGEFDLELAKQFLRESDKDALCISRQEMAGTLILSRRTFCSTARKILASTSNDLLNVSSRKRSTTKSLFNRASILR